jgi:glycosyltransferase involved in cell wall biosynthesis
VVCLPGVPWPLHSGWQLRAFHIVEALAARHAVHVVLYADESDRGALAESPLAARVEQITVVPMEQALFRAAGAFPIWHTSPRRRVTALLRDPWPSHIRGWYSDAFENALRERRAELGDVPVWADTAPCAEMARRAGFTRILVDYDDIESEQTVRALGRLRWGASRMLASADARKLGRYERGLVRRFGAVVLARPEDRPRLGVAQDRIFVVPNGVATRPLLADAHDGRTLLFVGSFGWEPNADAVEYFAREVMPRIRQDRPDARFVAVGRAGSPDWANRMRTLGVTVFESVPDVTRFYADAAAVVVPLRAGSGTKLKVLEAMMYGRPMVASTIAMEGIDGRDGDAVLVADAPELQAQACIRLLRDPSLGRALALRARAIVEAHYTWDAVATATYAAVAAIERKSA